MLNLVVEEIVLLQKYLQPRFAGEYLNVKLHF